MTIHLFTNDVQLARRTAAQLSHHGYTSLFIEPRPAVGKPSPKKAKMHLINSMLQADAVVVLPGAPVDPDLVAACRFAHQRLMELHRLPMPAPESFYELDQEDLTKNQPTTV